MLDHIRIPPRHTYSIVARDPETGALGAAVQSHSFNLGKLVVWVEAGAGAVATQAMGEPAHGYRGLALLRSGMAAPDALRTVLATDGGAELRQVAMVDAHGRAACHTGARCIACAGHHVGDGYSVQANMMLTDGVVPAMREAYDMTGGPLADRLLAALDAAQAAGGDYRGMQSAAIKITREQLTGEPWRDLEVDLRVEDHAEPLRELRRLVRLDRAYKAAEAAQRAYTQGEFETGHAMMRAALELAPEDRELRFWQGFWLAMVGDVDAGAAALRPLFDEDAKWVEMLHRLPPAGLMPEELARRLLEGTGRAPDARA